MKTATKTDAFRGQGALVIGLGLSGCSAVRFLLHHGAHPVIGVDRHADALRSQAPIAALCHQGMRLQKEEVSQIDWSALHYVIISPGIPPSHPFCQEAKRRGLPLLGEVELAARHIQQPCVGITGTNGKTTVTLLVEHVLNAAGVPAKALGNVEVPLAESLIDPSVKGKILVIELSSYQLDNLETPFLEAAALLNITPDHLDRYSTMKAYAAAKWKIGEILKEEKAPLLVEERAYLQYPPLAGRKESHLTYGYGPKATIRITEEEVLYRGAVAFPLPQEWRHGKNHDLENAMAAFGLCKQYGVTASQFLEAYRTFRKPPHRIEFVREVRGVRFYDDSKGTNIDAVVRAVQAVSGSIILIAGGVDKGASYLSWVKPFESRVKGICALGAAASKIYGELSPHLPIRLFNSLDEAVRGAFEWSEKGEAVLLSPGCSSYDMFRDYKHRGEEFQRLVKGISL